MGGDAERRGDGDRGRRRDLYWDLLDRHPERFAWNVRMAVPMAALRKLSPAKMADHRRWARAWREKARAAAYRGD